VSIRGLLNIEEQAKKGAPEITKYACGQQFEGLMQFHLHASMGDFKCKQFISM
jgi:hypothetical protein